MFAGDSGGPFPDITRMSINPKQRTSKPNHSRAQSESYLHFPDDLLLLDDPEIDLFDSTSASPMLPPNQNPYARHRSLSVDDDFFDDLGISYQGMIEAEGSKLPNDDDDDDGDDGVSGGGVKTHRRRHSFSIDASAHGMFDGVEFESGGVDCVKKAMASEKLTHMALIDPKKVKRILANRQSAARSKERKIRYTSELERKVQTLQTEATTLSAQVTLLQRDTSGLTCENKELKLRLQAMEQQAHLKEALNDTLKNEVYRLRIETGQIPASNGHSIYRPSLQYTQSSSHFYGAHQSLQNHPQTQQPKSSSNSNNQNPNQSVQTSFMDYSN